MDTIHSGGHLNKIQKFPSAPEERGLVVSLTFSIEEWEDILKFLKAYHLHLLEERERCKKWAESEETEVMRRAYKQCAEMFDTKQKNLSAYIDFIEKRVHKKS